MTKTGKIKYLPEIKLLLRQQGLQGLYRGFWATAWRDVPGWAVYFASFEQLKIYNAIINDKLGGNEETKRMRANLLLINAGGLAGLAGWIISFP